MKVIKKTNEKVLEKTIKRCKDRGVLNRRRLANHAVCRGDLGTVAAREAVLDEANGQVRDVDADPTAAEGLGGIDRRAAAAERIEHKIARP